jgi:hypothetical protein
MLGKRQGAAPPGAAEAVSAKPPTRRPQFPPACNALETPGPQTSANKIDKHAHYSRPACGFWLCGHSTVGQPPSKHLPSPDARVRFVRCAAHTARRHVQEGSRAAWGLWYHVNLQENLVPGVGGAAALLLRGRNCEPGRASTCAQRPGPRAASCSGPSLSVLLLVIARILKGRLLLLLTQYGAAARQFPPAAGSSCCSSGTSSLHAPRFIQYIHCRYTRRFPVSNYHANWRVRSAAAAQPHNLSAP